MTDGSLTAWSALEEQLEIPARDASRLWQEHLQVPADLGEISEEEIWASLAALRPGAREADIKEVFLSQYVELSHTIDVVKVAHASGWQLVLATNNVRSWFSWWETKFAWLSLFDEICCSSDLGVRKPDPAYFSLLQSVMQDQDGLFVDDKRVNVEAAAQAGLSATLVDQDGSWCPPASLAYRAR